jgi:ABC-2 type transport system permease protein
MNKILRPKQFLRLIQAHLLEILRAPDVIFWGIVFPILMSLGLGMAFTHKTNIIRHVAIVQTLAADSSKKISRFLSEHAQEIEPDDHEPGLYKYEIRSEKLGNTIFYFEKTDWQRALMLLKRGRLTVIMSEQNGHVEYHFDPTNPDAQLTFIQLSKIFSGQTSQLTESNADIEPMTIKGTRYIDFLIPGLISMGVMMSSMWGMSYGIIEKRGKKLLRRMVATPMKKSHFLLGLMSVRISMNFIESLLLFVFSFLVFGITIQGSILALLIIFLAGNFAFAGIAIFASSHTSKTEVGNGLINIVVLPMMIMSGIFFSYQNFPSFLIPVIQKLPLTLLADNVRSIFNEGIGLSQIFLPTLILLAIGITFFSAGLKLFKWY